MVLPSDMRLLIYFVLRHHSGRFQEERVCGLQTIDSTTYHGCHRRSVSELAPLRVRVLGISYHAHISSSMDCVETLKRNVYC